MAAGSNQSNEARRRAEDALRRGDLIEAERAAAVVLKTRKRDAAANAVLGHVAARRSQYDLAARYLEAAVAADRHHAGHLLALAQVNVARGRLDEALARYERVLKLRPDDPHASEGKADVLERRGRAARALAVVEPWIKRGTATPGMVLVSARALAATGRAGEAVDRLRAATAQAGLSPAPRRAMLLRLARLLDAQGEVDDAFAAAVEGNALSGVTYDDAAVAAKFDALRRAFDRETMPTLPRASGPTALPIFVFGMPRSGTTLVEQILHAHPDAHAAGETHHLAHVPRLLEQRLGGPYPACLGALDAATLDDLSAGFLKQMRTHDRKAPRIVDKSLENFEGIGLARLLCPEAPLVHVHRDPVDVCLSCFIQDLPPHLHPHANDLRSMGHFYRQYARLMDHWREHLPGAFLDLRYEDLVAEQERVSRALLEHVGLDWNEACLAFHTADRKVATISYDQVNKPIYTSAVARWRRYEKHLEPLLEVLGDLVE